MELRDESVCKEIKRKIERSGDNIKIVKLTQAIIKLQRELDRAYNKKEARMGIRSTIDDLSSRSNFEEVRPVFMSNFSSGT